MRRFAPILLIAAAGSLAANAALAQVSGDTRPVVSSSDEGALEAPEDWDCDRYLPEYREWLEQGKAPQDWRFAGKRYRAASDGDLYDWQEWLDWAEDKGCMAGALALPEASAGGGGGLFGNGLTAIGLVVGFLTTGLIAAGGGENAKSPG